MRKKLKEKVLAEGEVTGHAHRVTVPVEEDEKGLRYFSGSTEISHEEHKPITVQNKEWVSGKVIEFDYFDEMEREVRD